jgi:hypothetical protein
VVVLPVSEIPLQKVGERWSLFLFLVFLLVVVSDSVDPCCTSQMDVSMFLPVFFVVARKGENNSGHVGGS